MTKKFLIAGSIVDTDQDRWTLEDVTPVQVNSFLSKLEDGDEVEIEITSYGGSVVAGLAICNMLKQASANGHKTTAHVIGIAASMASAIACACDELKIDANSFLMVHNPYSMTMGNADEMRKEADTLDKFRDALLSIYRTKFSVDDEQLKKWLDEETWILGEQAELFNLKCEVIPTKEPLKIAASLKTPKFFANLKNTPKALREMIMENENKNEVKAEEVSTAEEVETTETTETTEVPDTATEHVEAVAEIEKIVEAKKSETAKTYSSEEVDKRVSGMQAAMQKQINDLKKDYELKIEDFTNQLKVRGEELTDAQAKITSLSTDLEQAKNANAELLTRASALESELAEKSDALAKLNADVNTPIATKASKKIKNGLVRVMQPNGSMKTID